MAEEKPSKLKRAFQWAAAVVAPFGCEPSNKAFEQAGHTYDYAAAWLGSKRKPKPQLT